jgi:hypothetical protein
LSIRKFPINRGFHIAKFHNTNSRSGEFKVLYVLKVDRLARRLVWSLEIIHEPKALDINFKAVQQPFNLGTPQGDPQHSAPDARQL